MKKLSWKRVVALHVPLGLYLLFTLFPIYWLVNTSLKPRNEIFTKPQLYAPQHPTLQNYADALSQTQILTLYRNSLIVSVSTCLVLLLLAIFGGYAMARFRFRAKSFVIFLFLLAQIFPPVIVLLPLFNLFELLGLVNSRLGLVIGYTAYLLPFTVLTMRSFFESVPEELDEAAMVDGCGRTRALIAVVLPAALPGLVATAIFGFIAAWNELIFAAVILSSQAVQTLPIGLAGMVSQYTTNYGLLMAAGTLALIPSLLLFSYIQRYLTTGLSAGAVKG